MTAKNDHSYQKRQMQLSLYQFARNRSTTFPNLYEKIYRPYVLKEAWEQIKHKRAGYTKDGLLHKAEVYGIDHLLSELRSELQYEAYRVLPFRPGTAEDDLAILKNDIAQAAVKIVLSPIFKAEYASGKNKFRSLHQLDTFVEEIRTNPDCRDYHILTTQISSCYDSIGCDKILELLKQRVSVSGTEEEYNSPVVSNEEEHNSSALSNSHNSCLTSSNFISSLTFKIKV